MKPSQVASSLIRITTALKNSKNPDKRLVVAALKKVIASVDGVVLESIPAKFVDDENRLVVTIEKQVPGLEQYPDVNVHMFGDSDNFANPEEHTLYVKPGSKDFYILPNSATVVDGVSKHEFIQTNGLKAKPGVEWLADFDYV
jgi:hypothetical protein